MAGLKIPPVVRRQQVRVMTDELVAQIAPEADEFEELLSEHNNSAQTAATRLRGIM